MSLAVFILMAVSGSFLLIVFATALRPSFLQFWTAYAAMLLFLFLLLFNTAPT